MAAVLDTVRVLDAPAFTFDPAFNFDIKTETSHDVAARELLLDRAMGPGRRRKSSEKIRRNRIPASGLALVARGQSQNVVGTVRLWNIDAGITADGSPVPALLLGPLAVDPACEGRGIGAALMREAIGRARSLGHGAIILVGDAPYYERFGFAAEKARHLVMPGPFERSRLLALELVDGWLDGAAGMIAPSGRLST